jgi:glutamate racemase
LLRPVIERVVGPGVAVVDSAFTTAIAVEDLLDALHARTPETDAGPAGNRVVTTGDVGTFTIVASRIFTTALPSVERVELGAPAPARP